MVERERLGQHARATSSQPLHALGIQALAGDDQRPAREIGPLGGDGLEPRETSPAGHSEVQRHRVHRLAVQDELGRLGARRADATVPQLLQDPLEHLRDLDFILDDQDSQRLASFVVPAPGRRSNIGPAAAAGQAAGRPSGPSRFGA